MLAVEVGGAMRHAAVGVSLIMEEVLRASNAGGSTNATTHIVRIFAVCLAMRSAFATISDLSLVHGEQVAVGKTTLTMQAALLFCWAAIAVGVRVMLPLVKELVTQKKALIGESETTVHSSLASQPQAKENNHRTRATHSKWSIIVP